MSPKGRLVPFIVNRMGLFAENTVVPNWFSTESNQHPSGRILWQCVLQTLLRNCCFNLVQRLCTLIRRRTVLIAIRPLLWAVAFREGFWRRNEKSSRFRGVALWHVLPQNLLRINVAKRCESKITENQGSKVICELRSSCRARLCIVPDSATLPSHILNCGLLPTECKYRIM